ncbi:hypothetical protein NDU88_004468 [Pleurodeles waltl]|uniref:Uncharacterized protein n=1 Tax=Pleurodeles waltl TaxID=8319 RepID=A0AAV7TS28_PLEWA|nr:hypothetical protein NDU88_004468 [Pleurodeles waltl]
MPPLGRRVVPAIHLKTGLRAVTINLPAFLPRLVTPLRPQRAHPGARLKPAPTANSRDAASAPSLVRPGEPLACTRSRPEHRPTLRGKLKRKTPLRPPRFPPTRLTNLA